MEAKAKFVGTAPQLVVPDVVKTATYYVEVLGFNLISYFLDPPVYAMVERDGFQLHFGKGSDNRVQTNRAISREVTDLIIWVPQIELYFAEVKSNGANITQEIMQRSYGREFIITDCDNHQILVCD